MGFCNCRSAVAKDKTTKERLRKKENRKVPRVRNSIQKINMEETKTEVPARQTGKAEQYLHIINDTNFEDFYVLNTANGWWLNRVKVELLVAAYKIDCTDEEACSYAGISMEQLKYFKELHPDFSRVKTACKQLPFLTARNTIVSGLATDHKLALEYMERKKKFEFGKRDEHVVIPTERTLEDLLDEYENKNDTDNEQGADRKPIENKEQAGGNSPV
jgi:hypothetical protein